MKLLLIIGEVTAALIVTYLAIIGGMVLWSVKDMC